MSLLQTILAVLVVMCLCDVYRVYRLTHPAARSKKALFMSKLRSAREMRFELEFKIFKTREMREEIRGTYDELKAKLFNTEEQLKAIPEGKDERKAVEDNIAKLNEEIKRYEGQLAMLDREINGEAPTELNPQGSIGVLEQIDSCRELETMFGDYIKTL